MSKDELEETTAMRRRRRQTEMRALVEFNREILPLIETRTSLDDCKRETADVVRDYLLRLLDTVKHTTLKAEHRNVLRQIFESRGLWEKFQIGKTLTQKQKELCSELADVTRHLENLAARRRESLAKGRENLANQVLPDRKQKFLERNRRIGLSKFWENKTEIERSELASRAANIRYRKA